MKPKATHGNWQGAGIGSEVLGPAGQCSLNQGLLLALSTDVTRGVACGMLCEDGKKRGILKPWSMSLTLQTLCRIQGGLTPVSLLTSRGSIYCFSPSCFFSTLSDPLLHPTPQALALCPTRVILSQSTLLDSEAQQK